MYLNIICELWGRQKGVQNPLTNFYTGFYNISITYYILIKIIKMSSGLGC